MSGKLNRETAQAPRRGRGCCFGVLAATCMLAGAVGTAVAGVDPGSATPPAPDQAARKASPYRLQRVSAQARQYYDFAWGVDKMTVIYTSSGNLIRFSYRVSDARRAGVLADKAATPYLVGLRSHAVLHVPQMDKVGTLRQTAPQQDGQEYWMVFSNKGNLVRPGDRVNVVIGPFHADGLVVQ
jgi:hypothetical protein